MNTTSGFSQTGAKLDEVLALGRPALIGYLPIGYPSVELSIEAANAMIDAGVDIVEFGLPYSDPVMDGPVIQRAVDGALKSGFRVRDAFRAVEAVRAHAPHVPVLLMSYLNPVLRYGIDAFARDLAAAGGAGLITPDLVPDEGRAWIDAATQHDLDRIFLAAPSSTPERLRMTADASRGFVYAASTMGVTGERARVGEEARRLVADTRAAGADHVAVGLGVSTEDQAAEVGSYADGVIVGSAFVSPLVGDAVAFDDIPWAERLDGLQAIAERIAQGVHRARKATS
jgi:tryptophan synthase alpha chain